MAFLFSRNIKSEKKRVIFDKKRFIEESKRRNVYDWYFHLQYPAVSRISPKMQIVRFLHIQK